MSELFRQAAREALGSKPMDLSKLLEARYNASDKVMAALEITFFQGCACA